MKKSLLFISILAFVAVFGVFANGQSEAEELGDTWDTVTVTGAVSFKDWPNPELTSRGKTYELIVPRFAEENIEIESGDEITIEGIVVDGAGTDETYLMVVKAIIDGEEYVVPFRGMMGGPAYGGMRCDEGWYPGNRPGDQDFSRGRGGRW